MAAFSGGGKIRAFLEKAANGLGLATKVEAGFFDDAIYPDGTPVAFVAMIQDQGAPDAGIPPRPFYRNFIAKNQPQWGKTLFKLTVKNYFNTQKALNQMGDVMIGQLQQSIIDLLEPPLSPTTIMLRKMKMQDPDLVITFSTVQEARARVAAGESTAGASTKPLIDTGFMLRSVGKKVS
jgi:hypothetical protein